MADEATKRVYLRVRTRCLSQLRSLLVRYNETRCQRRAHAQPRTLSHARYDAREIKDALEEIRTLDLILQEHAEAQRMRDFWMLRACGHCFACALSLKSTSCHDIQKGKTCRERVGGS